MNSDGVEEPIHWPGLSREKYKYSIFALDADFMHQPGNYIFAKKSETQGWEPVYIGQSFNLKRRLQNHDKITCIKYCGATHIHVHFSSVDDTTRKNETLDLVKRWLPACNG